MALICPECREPQLQVVQNLELPPDGRSDETSLQLIACSGCGFWGAAVYEESRRGPSDSFHHTAYDLPLPALAYLKKRLLSCPQSQNSHCDCEVHRELGRCNHRGIWLGLEALLAETLVVGAAQLSLLRRFPIDYQST